MTPDELSRFLKDKQLLETVDVKTLVIDQVKQKPVEELMPLFRSMLPELSAEEMDRYLYMSRT